jgi:hypothetical protein
MAEAELSFFRTKDRLEGVNANAHPVFQGVTIQKPPQLFLQ